MKVFNRRGHGRLAYSGCTPMATPLPVGGRNVSCAVMLEKNKINQ